MTTEQFQLRRFRHRMCPHWIVKQFSYVPHGFLLVAEVEAFRTFDECVGPLYPRTFKYWRTTVRYYLRVTIS